MVHHRKSLVVVGHGMVGHRLVQAAIERGLTERYDIVVLGEEPRAAYDRVALTSFFSAPNAESLSLLPGGSYEDPRVTLRLGCAAVSVDREQRVVHTTEGDQIRYDAVVLATGSAPFVPPLPGRDLPGCFVYRTIEDLEAIRDAAATVGTGVVIGGGLLGLEAANALRQLGLQTHVVEMAPRLMPVQLDEAAGATLVRHIEGLGVTTHCGVRTQEVQAGPDGRVAALALADADPIATDMVVFSAGIRPRDDLARSAGLEVGPRGGIVVDSGCRTSDPEIFAIGECAAPGGRVYGLVAPGYAMAEVAVDRLLDGAGEFTGADMSTKLKLMGVDVASFGDAHGSTEGSLELVFSDALTGVYKKLVVTADATRLLGGILVGDAAAYGLLRPMVASGIALPDNPEDLILPASRGTTQVGLPDEAVVCSCQNVTRGAICSAVDGSGDKPGCADLPCLKACTKAGTVCGSCVPTVKSLLAERLAAAGREVSTALCEHFPLTRQQMFDLISVKGYRSFTVFLADHGTGRGCDICKPTVASILASLTSTHILEPATAGLQDTNDAYLGNIQRNGTYSVVPRVPGGEITPDGLIAIGEVARDFGLYTKITGGQRIDLLGARLEQLPAIWRRLVDAGFESGQAYGKSIRTVKSCVGSTWCRYGVQDSVSLAIDLELRYRGLRSPHKLKGGVSGCARECAEARGKDFGVIATEKGWNLYVGGNGGFKPAHAVEFATDLDTETLVRYLDRFLIFYIRTADRLQRTSVWLDQIDGGLDYVRSVVVDDALGIAADLDAEMARHVGGYSDEWAATLQDPDKLARFVSFVNAPGTPDPSIQFVAERGQRRPAREGEPVLLGDRIPVGAGR
ncbi:MAG TPA: nitrite reductase large subunit NirB [Dermatophilaceae bacterium]|nr:nitrite reductase large subunit NirB [Dermatophilaceae bacterium]